MLKVETNNNLIKIISDKSEKNVSMKSNIRSFLVLNNSVIIMLDYEPSYNDRNIFKLSDDGTIIWQVQAPDPYNVPRTACFTYLGVDSQGTIKAGSMNGFSYDVDFETGQLLNKRFTK